MKRLKTRQERFCERFVELGNASAAAKAAGYLPASARNTGYRLLRDPRVISRIAAIQAQMADDHCRQVDILLGKLETVFRRALDDHQFSAAARAIELQAKLAGLGERPQVRAPARREKAANGPPDDASETA